MMKHGNFLTLSSIKPIQPIEVWKDDRLLIQITEFAVSKGTSTEILFLKQPIPVITRKESYRICNKAGNWGQLAAPLQNPVMLVDRSLNMSEPHNPAAIKSNSKRLYHLEHQ